MLAVSACWYTISNVHCKPTGAACLDSLGHHNLYTVNLVSDHLGLILASIIIQYLTLSGTFSVELLQQSCII